MLYASSGKTKPRPQEPTFDNPNVHHLVRLAFWNKFKFKLLTFIIYVLLCCEYLETTEAEPPDWRALYSVYTFVEWDTCLLIHIFSIRHKIKSLNLSYSFQFNDWLFFFYLKIELYCASIRSVKSQSLRIQPWNVKNWYGPFSNLTLVI